MRAMSKGRTLIIASVAGAAMVLVGVVAASASGKVGTTIFLAASSPSPSPGFKSNEASSHEASESAAQETAENNGTFHPGGPGGGHPNETAAHESSESAAREAAENARASSTATPSATR